MTRLRTLLAGGLSATAALWGPVVAAYDWVFRAAAILANVAGRSGTAVKASYRGLLGAMARHAAGAGNLAGALGQFRKVTRSYWSGLFVCYEVADLPRTNNDLEQLFGAHRYHERRSSGRKVASPGLVVRGGPGNPAPGRGAGRGPGAVGSGRLAQAPRRVGATPSGPGAGPAVSPRPRRISSRA